MKLRNIFTALTAAALALVGCQKEAEFLDEVQVSKSFVSLPVEGGEASITVTATADWAFEVSDVWPEVIVKDKDGNETSRTPSWLSVDVTSGAAGETVVTFSAEATTETREVTLLLACAGVKQNVKVLQMAEKVETPLSTCAEVNNNGVDGKVYRVKGTVTSIANTTYGNWYLQDDTGTVYIYGTLYNGATQQFSKLGLEVGDIVTVEGPRKNYNGTIELVDVTVLEIEKSLLKLEKMMSTPLPLEGGVATALLTVKAGEFSVEIPEDATWLTAGDPYKIGDLTAVELTATPNEAGTRKTTVTFKTNVDGKEYIAPAEIEQLGAIAEVTVAEFLAKEKGDALYKLTGKVSGLKAGNYGNFHLVDATGSVYVYGLTATPVEKNDQSFPTLGIREGDIVTLIGKRDQYAGAKVEEEKEQVGGPAYYVSHIGSTDVTVAEFLAKPVSNDVRYRLTGEITSLKTGNYGNFQLKDETGSVYVYGLTVAPVAKNDQSFPTLGLKEGDIVTLVGTRAQYASAKVEEEKEQVGGPAYYISHVEGAPAVDPWEAAATFTNPAEGDDAKVKELKAYADADYFYIRITSTKETPFFANYFDIQFSDGEGETALWWGWTTTGTKNYYQEHKNEIDENGNITKMRWYTDPDTRVYVDDYTTTITDTEIVWEIKYPRAYIEAYKSSTNTVRMSVMTWKDWGEYWVIPARSNEMLEVAL